MKITVALYKDSSGCEMVHTKAASEYATFTRISEWVEIEFPPRIASEAIEEEVKSIDREMERVVDDNIKKLRALRAKKVAVLSKIFQPEVVE